MPYSPETRRLYDKQRYREKNPPKTQEQKLMESAKKKRIRQDKKNRERKAQRAIGRSLSQTFGITMSSTPSKTELKKAMEPLTPMDLGEMVKQQYEDERKRRLMIEESRMKAFEAHIKVEETRMKEVKEYRIADMDRNKWLAKLTTPQKSKAESPGSETFSSEEEAPMAARSKKDASDDKEEVSDGYYTPMNEDSDEEEEKEGDSDEDEDEESVVVLTPKVNVARRSIRAPKAAAKKASKPAAKHAKKAAPKYAKKEPPKAAAKKEPPKAATKKEPPKAAAKKDPPKAAAKKDPPKSAKKDPPKSVKKDPPVDDKEMARIKGLTKSGANKELLALDKEAVDATPLEYLKALAEQAKWGSHQIAAIKKFLKAKFHHSAQKSDL